MSNVTSPRTVPGRPRLSSHETAPFLTDAQLRAELAKCELCEDKPCREACPCHCSPADFIKALEVGAPADFKRAAGLILSQNPLGGVCGMVCPDRFCMAACVHRRLDGAVRVPELQAAVIERARREGQLPHFERPAGSGQRVAVIGSGPAGLGAAATLARLGYRVTIREKEQTSGGMCTCIPPFRLDPGMLKGDLAWLLELGEIEVQHGREVTDPVGLFDEGYQAVIVATGLWTPIRLGIPGEEHATAGIDVLRRPEAFDLSGRVVVIGGGATAYDVAMTALARGAKQVEMLALETLAEMPLTRKEMESLQRSGVDVSGRVRVTAIKERGGRVAGITTEKVRLRGEVFSLTEIEAVPGTITQRDDLDTVLTAIGLRSAFPRVDHARVFYAGDCADGPTTVVEATASGKNAAERVHALLSSRPAPAAAPSPWSKVKSRVAVPGYVARPVPLQSEFFGRPILSPFLLSAAPPTDGLEQMRRAYQAGWAGGIMKTAFDGVPIHIPAEYMFAFDLRTYANCDNVSGHPLDRVCREVEQLLREFPDRLTMASTGGPVTGDDAHDSKGWQHNTRKLEAAGVMGIEYSLSCPQGGDGTEGDIVSQNAQLSAKIVDWVLSAGSADVPKLFKLTGAVTSVASIVTAIKEVIQRHPGKKAGVTLANSFPSLAFRPGQKKSWDEGIVVGASGAGILNISYLSLAKVAHLGVEVSGNGGPMDYKAAADFLALGARTVQFCTLVMRYGYGIVEDMESGLSHLLQSRGLGSVKELIGAALPGPITDFMALSPVKKISSVDEELCLQCGNCSRCPYLAISHKEDGFPTTDASRCVGCSICSLKCFARAIRMRARTKEEAAALKES